MTKPVVVKLLINREGLRLESAEDPHLNPLPTRERRTR